MTELVSVTFLESLELNKGVSNQRERERQEQGDEERGAAADGTAGHGRFLLAFFYEDSETNFFLKSAPILHANEREETDRHLLASHVHAHWHPDAHPALTKALLFTVSLVFLMRASMDLCKEVFTVVVA
jgi:hypothetical protein